MGISDNTKIQCCNYIKDWIRAELEEFDHNFTDSCVSVTDITDFQDDVCLDVRVELGNTKFMKFKIVNPPTHKFECDEDFVDLFVDMHEDTWEQITGYDHRAKYFWIALLGDGGW